MRQRKIRYLRIPPNENGEFTAHMENVLETYAQPYDERFPVLCKDEQPVQLIEDINIQVVFVCGASLPSRKFARKQRLRRIPPILGNEVSNGSSGATMRG